MNPLGVPFIRRYEDTFVSLYHINIKQYEIMYLQKKNTTSITYPLTMEVTKLTQRKMCHAVRARNLKKSWQVSLTTRNNQLKWYVLREISLIHRIRIHSIRIAEQTIRLINHRNFVPHWCVHWIIHFPLFVRRRGTSAVAIIVSHRRNSWCDPYMSSSSRQWTLYPPRWHFRRSRATPVSAESTRRCDEKINFFSMRIVPRVPKWRGIKRKRKNRQFVSSEKKKEDDRFPRFAMLNSLWNFYT